MTASAPPNTRSFALDLHVAERRRVIAEAVLINLGINGPSFHEPTVAQCDRQFCWKMDQIHNQLCHYLNI